MSRTTATATTATTTTTSTTTTTTTTEDPQSGEKIISRNYEHRTSFLNGENTFNASLRYDKVIRYPVRYLELINTVTTANDLHNP
jgi:hypothetical protein